MDDGLAKLFMGAPPPCSRFLHERSLHGSSDGTTGRRVRGQRAKWSCGAVSMARANDDAPAEGDRPKTQPRQRLIDILPLSPPSRTSACLSCHVIGCTGGLVVRDYFC